MCDLNKALILTRDEPPDGGGWDWLGELDEDEGVIEPFKRLDRNSGGKKVEKLRPIAWDRGTLGMIVSSSFSERVYPGVAQEFYDKDGEQGPTIGYEQWKRKVEAEFVECEKTKFQGRRKRTRRV